MGIENYHLVDVQPAGNRDVLLKEILHIPLAELPLRVSEIPRDKPIIFCCTMGDKSWSAALFFQRKYPESVVYSLEGGYLFS